MPTVNSLSLDTVIQVRADISPGVSGWDNSAEESSVSTLVGAAMTTLGITRPPFPEGTILAISNNVIDRLIAEVNPTVTDIRSAEEIWANAPGQLLAALINVQADLQALVDLEPPDEIAASSGPGKGKGKP